MVHKLPFEKAAVTDVHRFMYWYLGEERPILPIPNGVKTMPMSGQDVARTAMDAVVFRQGRFQVQLFCFPAYTVIPEHLHPNVRSYEFYFGGTVSFSKDKKWLVHHCSDTYIPRKKRHCYISENTWHGGLMGPEGGMFLSIQEWLNGVSPSCVGNDWEGKSCVKDHFIDSETLNVEHENLLNWKTAASKEKLPPAWYIEYLKSN